MVGSFAKSIRQGKVVASFTKSARLYISSGRDDQGGTAGIVASDVYVSVHSVHDGGEELRGWNPVTANACLRF